MIRKRSPRRRTPCCSFETLEQRDLFASIQLSPLGTYNSGVFNASGAEIVAYDAGSQRAFFTSAINTQNAAASNRIGVLDLSNPANPTLVASIDLAPYGGGPNSVAVHDGLVAVAVEALDKTALGSVVFFDTNGVFLKQVTVGALPDMLTFTSDGRKVIVANEGEPNSYNQTNSVDPEGSISIIDLSRGLNRASVATAGFTSFNSQQAELLAAGVRIYGPNATVAQDLEPEYITLSDDNKTAYVTLQENNALAVVDLRTAKVTSILPLGYKDHNLPGNGLDVSDRDTPGSSNNGLINIRNVPVLGMYLPDAIDSFEVGGVTYLITANEGDARDWTGYTEEARVGSLSLDAAAFAAQGYPDVSTGASGLKHNDHLGRLNVTTSQGDIDNDGDFDRLYALGGRSFSIWTTTGQLVYDSGDAIEQITAAAYPANFNSDHAANEFDTRSDNKGPEPEAVTTGVINGRTFAFVGLERIGGIMVYDVTNPQAPVFEQYINNRNFTQTPGPGTGGDLGVEGLRFVSAADSPTGGPLLIGSQEVSGSVTVFQISGAVLNKGVLEIIGTSAADTVDVTRSGNQLFVAASFLGLTGHAYSLGNVSLIVISTLGGDDRATLGSDVAIHSIIFGGDGNDVLTGGKLSDLLDGGNGNDTLIGNAGVDFLFGGMGDDTLKGGKHGDFLFGGPGRDQLDGGEGLDWLFGGFGRDAFRKRFC